MEALPLSLSEADGTLKKTPKSALLHKLEQDVEPVSDLPIGCAILMDGMALVRQIKTTKMTYSQFATVLLKKVLSIGRDSSRIDVVFDVYLDNSIKDVERNRRPCRKLKLQQIIPDAEIKQWALLLSSNDKLIRFIVEHWKSNSNLINAKEYITTVDSKSYKINLNDCSLIQELQSNHQEANTRLLLHANMLVKTMTKL